VYLSVGTSLALLVTRGLSWLLCLTVPAQPVALFVVENFVFKTSFIGIIFGILAGAAISISLAGLVVIYGVWQTKNRVQESTFSSKFSPTPFSTDTALSQTEHRGSVPTLEGRPSVTRESALRAIEAFNIQVPKNVTGPFIKSDMNDRGMTVRSSAFSPASVYVGPEAFTSWALLGSTLAHEIEVHCRQNFLSIHFQSLAGIDSVGEAEREAYAYEIANANRFGLSDYERNLIQSTSAYYYPELSNSFFTRLTPIRTWLNTMAANAFTTSQF
jgi:hypothetical protein